MQKFTQKYTIITLLEDINEGYEYSAKNWPLHITIADTFSIDWEINDLAVALSKLAQTLHRIQVCVSHDEYFGAANEILVAIIKDNEGLTKLHYEVVRLLKKGGAKFNDPQYTETGFRAHSTVQTHARINVNDVILIKNLAIIDMFPGSDPFKRKIIKTIPLPT